MCASLWPRKAKAPLQRLERLFLRQPLPLKLFPGLANRILGGVTGSPYLLASPNISLVVSVPTRALRAAAAGHTCSIVVKSHKLNESQCKPTLAHMTRFRLSLQRLHLICTTLSTAAPCSMPMLLSQTPIHARSELTYAAPTPCP
jgi:hypothetical protein